MSALVWGRRLVAVALLSFLVVAFLDTAFGRDVTLLHTLHDEAERAQARALYDPRDDVAEIYGRVEPQARQRVLVFDADRLIVPPEDPARRLLFVDRAAGQRVTLARALWWRVGLVVVPMSLLGLILLVGRRRPPAQPGV